MKKSVLLVLLSNICDDADKCNCPSIKRKVLAMMEMIKKEGVENDN